ncbi:MAG: transglutaminase family protein [Gammaproteobacteria bacterium]|jgi:transglutaminase-like putative cysteine protease
MSRIEYQVVHETVYTYAWQVTNGQHYARLTPRHTAVQEVLWSALEFLPSPAEISKHRDYYGNHCHIVLIQTPHETLHVTATALVRVEPQVLGEAHCLQAWECALPPSLYTPEPLEIADMRLATAMTPNLNEGLQMARRFFTPQRPWFDAMLDLTRHINTEFAYDPEATQIDTPLSEVFATKRGVCQDFAHLMLSCLRSLELPARYVSGYILNEPPPGEEKLVGGDASHAWVEAWLPEAGWIGFDPTNGKLANAEFITIGWGRDYNDIAPLRGIVLGGGEHDLEVRVTVTRIG